MSKQERSVPSYVEYPYEQAILYVHRNASANEMLESVQERLRALLGLLHALERIEVRTGQGRAFPFSAWRTSWSRSAAMP
ncbi:hypothetical protein AJ61_05633 [Pseudomonas aeruginosa 3574]|nr:hypothetical protein AJ61_05633 [Pseudomonas aeruginosa 3574]